MNGNPHTRGLLPQKCPSQIPSSSTGIVQGKPACFCLCSHASPAVALWDLSSPAWLSSLCNRPACAGNPSACQSSWCMRDPLYAVRYWLPLGSLTTMRVPESTQVRWVTPALSLLSFTSYAASRLCLYPSPCRPCFCPPSPTFAAFSLLCTTSPLAFSQHPQQLIASRDRAVFPRPGTKSRVLPCQHLITLQPAQRTLQTLCKPKKPINLALAGGKWRHRGLGPACGNLLACIIAPAPLPAGGLWGEIFAIQQCTGGIESAGRRKSAAVSCPQPPPASFNRRAFLEGNQRTFIGFLICYSY